MNPVEHHSTVDRGLKMKIKRKNVASSKSEGPKHEIIQSDSSKALNLGLTVTTSSQSDSTSGMGSPSTLDKLKQTLADKERDRIQTSKVSNTSSLNNTQGPISPYRTMNNKRKNKTEGVVSGNGSSANSSFVLPASSAGMDSNIGVAAASGSNTAGNGSILPASSVMVELHRMNKVMGVKKEPAACDPYEFNAKEEDRIGLPIVKKVKAEKMDEPASPGAAQSEVDMEQRDVGTETSSVGVATDPDCLGPCEPGTSVVLEGIVWNETENGILVVNITWRGKTYVGTLMDATKHAWAPPRFNCDSPAATSEARPCRGRGKRRAPVTPPVDMGERRLRKRKNNTNPYAAPPSPAKSESNTPKRRGRPADLDLDLDNIRTSKRPRTTKNSSLPAPENGFIECPEPNCSKKYRHINGLRYHQAHAHKNDYVDEEMDTEVEEKTPAEEIPSKPVLPSPSTKPGRGRKATVTSPCEDQSAESQNSSENGAPDNKPETASRPGKKGKKDEKQANLDSKKQLDKQPTVALTQVNMDGKKSVTSPPGSGYQTSTMTPLSSCVTTVSVVPSTAGIQSTTTTSTVSTVAMTTVVQSSEKSKKSKGEKLEKKGKGGRGAASVSLVPTTVSSPAQISIAAASLPQNNAGGLKPIQPKPTVLGETSSPNSALAGLKEQRKPKKKKNKDKDKDKESSKDKQCDASHKDLTTIDMSVIQMTTPAEKVASSTSLTSSVVTGNKSLEALVKMSNPPELQKQAVVQLGSTIDKTNSPPELQKQLPLPKVNSPMKSIEGGSTRPPSSLSLNSPVPNNVDNKDTSSASAQSPAYSDISDANDSNMNMDSDSAPVKVKVEPNTQKATMETSPKPQDPSSSDQPQAQGGFQGGMYGSYYPQGAYHSPSSNHSTQSRDGQKISSQGTPNKSADKSKPSDTLVTPKVEKVEDSKSKERMDKDMVQKGSPNPAQMREYQERMMAAQAQQMAQYHQYMGAYGYGVDMRLLATNPEYKAQYEKWLMDQGRARREMMEHQAKMAKSSDGKAVAPPHDLSRPLDLNTKAMDLSKQGKGSPSTKPGHLGEGRSSPLDIKQEGFRPRDFMPDVRPKETTSEGSSHDDDRKDGRSRQMSGGNGNPLAGGYERQGEYHRRYQMFQQQQRVMEHKRYMEQQQQQGDCNKVCHPGSPMDMKRGAESSKLPQEGAIKVPDLPNSYHNKLSHSGNRNSLSDVRGSDQAQKSDKDKVKGTSLPPSPAGSKAKDQYGQYYHHQGYPGYPHPPYDSSHPMYQAQGGATPHGYNQNSYPPYPPHMRGSFPEGAFKDSAKTGTPRTSSPGAKPNSSQSHAPHTGASEGKALELLQQKAATYYNTHSPHAAPQPSQKHLGKDASAAKVTDKPVDGPGKDASPEAYDSASLKSAIVAGKDKVEGKDRDGPSPPTQRHVHTHHHTHVVGPAHYSLYGPYGALMTTQQSGATPAAAAANIPYASPK